MKHLGGGGWLSVLSPQNVHISPNLLNFMRGRGATYEKGLKMDHAKLSESECIKHKEGQEALDEFNSFHHISPTFSQEAIIKRSRGTVVSSTYMDPNQTHRIHP